MKKKSLSHKYFTIEYSLNNNRFRITNNPKGLDINKNLFLLNGEAAYFDQLKLPNNLLATSIMLNDKFPFVKSSPESFYQYLGSRRSNAVATTKTFLKRTLNSIIENINNTDYQFAISKVLEFLGFDNYLSIKFQLRYREKIFNEVLTVKDFNNFFINWHVRRRTEPYSIAFYNIFKKDKEQINDLISFIRNLSTLNIRLPGKAILEYDLIYGENILKDYRFLLVLSKLDLISIESITVKKRVEYDFGNASSGEFQIFSSLLGILANIKNDSLILLDEPEISLHPNWQMKYINFIKSFFSNYPSCHFILASHSHFIVSDLEPSTSRLIGLKRESSGKIGSLEVPKSTYGWSTDEILYSIFNVKSMRNYFLEYDLTYLISLLNKNSDNFMEIEKIVNKINQLELSPNDPIHIIIEKANKYLRDKNA